MAGYEGLILINLLKCCTNVHDRFVWPMNTIITVIFENECINIVCKHIHELGVN